MITKIPNLGRTTEQMIAAPKNALFVWYGNQRYAIKLRNRQGRKDLTILPLYALDEMTLRGHEFTDIIIDHGAQGRLSKAQIRVVNEAKLRVQKLK